MDKLVSNGSIKLTIRFMDDSVGLLLRNKSIDLTVLYLRKLIMYELRYRYALSKYGSRIGLLMTDTDSLLYHIVTDDVKNRHSGGSSPFQNIVPYINIY